MNLPAAGPQRLGSLTCAASAASQGSNCPAVGQGLSTAQPRALLRPLRPRSSGSAVGQGSSGPAAGQCVSTAQPRVKGGSGQRCPGQAAQQLTNGPAVAHSYGNVSAQEGDVAQLNTTITPQFSALERVRCDSCGQLEHFRKCRVISKKAGRWRCPGCGTTTTQLRRSDALQCQLEP